jgi:hypothetical protein
MKKLLLIILLLVPSLEARETLYECTNGYKLTNGTTNDGMSYYEFELEGTVTTYLNCNWIGSHNYPTDEIVGTYVGNVLCGSVSSSKELADGKTELNLRSGNFFISQKGTWGLKKRTTIEAKRYFRIGEDEINESIEPYECEQIDD